MNPPIRTKLILIYSCEKNKKKHDLLYNLLNNKLDDCNVYIVNFDVVDYCYKRKRRDSLIDYFVLFQENFDFDLLYMKTMKM